MSAALWGLIGKGILETLYMTLFSTVVAYIIGLPLGVILVVTDKKGIHPIRRLNAVLNVLVNIFRSIPFLILMIFLMPFTQVIVGTSIGPTAACVSLIIAAAPFIARLVESSIQEVDSGVIEAAQSMGASPMRIIWNVMLAEARPSLLVGSAIATTTILSYSAMAGICGGGGLGTIAINYGYYRFQDEPMLVTIVFLVVIVQVMQEIGMRIAKRIDKRARA